MLSDKARKELMNASKKQLVEIIESIIELNDTYHKRLCAEYDLKKPVNG